MTKTDFEGLVGRIQATSDALQQDALVVINRSVTARAWITGCYIVEYEQHGLDRAKYGERRVEGMLPKLAIFASEIAELAKDVKPVVEETLAELGIPLPSVILKTADGALLPPTTSRDAISPQPTLSLTTGRISMRCR